LYIDCYTDDSTISLNFVGLDDVKFHFCERLYGLEYGLKSEVSVCLPECCVV